MIRSDVTMRRAEAHELTDQAVPVITARITEAELAKWLPIHFDQINDPLQAPEPSLGALAELDTGGYVVLNYGRDSKQLTIEVPETTANASALLAAFFREVPLPTSRVLWLRRGIRLPKNQAATRSAAAKGQKRQSSPGGTTRQPAKRSALRVTAPAKRK